MTKLQRLVMKLFGIKETELVHNIYRTERVEKEVVVHIARLSDAVFQDFRKKVTNGIYVSHQTTEIQAGHMLGVQHVLNLLQENLTIPNS